ncbi:MAG TPA: hypothetical protein VGY54_26280, partial [Polyangiaceae bacterium]|nr:hypothetical protein [Polyangiaceae bacterium]
MNFLSRRNVITAFAFALLIAIVACSSGVGRPDDSKRGQAVNASDYPYTFKFYAQQGDTKRLIKVVPQEVALAQRRTAQGTTSTTHGAGPHLLDFNAGAADSDGGTTPFTIAANDVNGPDLILAAAAAECGMVEGNFIPPDDPLLEDLRGQRDRGQRIVNATFVSPWASHQGYYLFAAPPEMCDDVLEYEETLVCIADKLAQIADTVQNVEWHAVQFSTFIGKFGSQPPPSAWIIPPQSDLEKFILRDLAIDVLAHVPALDGFTGTTAGRNFSAPCSTLYTTSSDVTELYGLALGTPIGPDLAQGTPPPIYPPYPTDGRSLPQERQAFEANVLRAAGQLLHDLIRESVYSDLAGGAANSGAAADRRGGQGLEWGLDGQHPYNSLAHVARTLFGRWEMDLNDPDPICDPQLAGELDLLPTLVDPGTRARANELPPLTPGEQLADTLFEQSGLVIVDDPNGQYVTAVDGGSSSPLQQTLLTQLVAVKSAAVGMAPTAFANSPSGQALAQLVSTLGPSDLAHGAAHNRTTFTVLTSFGTDQSSFGTGLIQGIAAGIADPLGLGLTLSAPGGTSGPSAFSVAVAGGLTRALATMDPAARTGHLMTASQCSENDGMVGILADEQFIPPVPSFPVDANGNPLPIVHLPNRYLRQDAFSVANAIRSRLVKLRERAEFGPDGTPAMNVDVLGARARAAAIAELGAWAGSGRAILSTDQGDTPSSNQPASLYLDLIGVDPKDFGVSSISEIQNVVSLVSAPFSAADWAAAECAANLKVTSCPTESYSRLTPVLNAPNQFQSFTVATNDPNAPSALTLHRRFGVTGASIRLTFPFTPLNTGSPTFGLDFTKFYIVLSQDPLKAPGVGAVLGALRLAIPNDVPPIQYGEVSIALSPMRRELLNEAFGLGKWVGVAPPRAGDLPIAGTPSFCIEGVPRDIFVPLQNDLSSDADTYENSWRHYLSLAQTAADRADQIGQTLIDVGFQKDTNIENAGDQLMTLNGEPANVDDITVDGEGKIIAGSLNGGLGDLLTQPAFDLVLFSTDPTHFLRSDDTTGKDCGLATPLTGPTAQALADGIGCPAAQNPPLPNVCGKLRASPAPAVAAIPAACAASFKGASGYVTYTALNMAPAFRPPQASACASFVSGAAAMKGVFVDTHAVSDGRTMSPADDNAAGRTADATSMYRGLGPPFLPAATGPGSTTFNSSAFLDGLTTWSGDQTSIQSTLTNIHMTVRNDASWTVTAGGAPIMESNKDFSWPGCLIPDAGNTAAACDWTNPLIDALNDLFRSCPAGFDLRSALGTCDGG